jgi:hypothetical protein
MSGAYREHGEMRNRYKILFGKSERKTSLGRLRHRRKDIEMVFKEFG